MQFSKELITKGLAQLRLQAAASFVGANYGVRALEKHVKDSKYVGVLKLLFDDNLWAGVVAVSNGSNIRTHKKCKGEPSPQHTVI